MEGRTIVEVSALAGIPESTLEKLSKRKGWKTERDTLERLPELIKNSTEKGISDAVVETAATLARQQVQRHLSRVMEVADSVMGKLGKNLMEEMHLPALLEHQSAEACIRSFQRMDDLGRRAMGLPDTIASVDVTSGGMSTHQTALSVLDACKFLVSSGKADARTIDIEGLKNAMLQDSESEKHS